MQKIIRFSRDSVFLLVGLGILVVILYFSNQKMLSVWLAHIWTVFYFMPIAYDLTGSLNMGFCCNPALECERNSGIRKKVTLNTFWKKFFFAYDENGNMLLLVLAYQSFLFLCICVFLLLNIIFVVAFLTNNANVVGWKKLWIFEIVAQYVIFGIVMLFTYLKDIYLWSKVRKSQKYSSISSDNMIKTEMRIFKLKKVIKQKNQVFDFLKQYGLCVDKHKNFMISSYNVKQVEKALLKEFPKLHISFSEEQKGERLLKVYNAKKDYLLIQVEIR